MVEMHSLKASVVIPTKGRPTLVRAAINSVLNVGCEVVVVNDGGTADLAKISEGFHGPNLRVLQNELDPGPSGARNFGVAQSGGQLIFFLDDDDTFLPGYIQDIVSITESAAAAAQYGFSSRSQNGKVKSIRRPTGLVPADAELADYLAPLSSGFWVRRTAFDDIGGLDVSFDINEDTEFCLRLASAGMRCWFSAKPGVLISPVLPEENGQMQSLTKRSQSTRRADAFRRILQKHAVFLSQHHRQRKEFAAALVKHETRASGAVAGLRAAREYQLGTGMALLRIAQALLKGKK